MNNIQIRDIDETNERMVRNVRVKIGQETFVESVDECLAEAKGDKRWHPVALYSEEDLIGFAMYGSFGPNKNTWIDRIIIDHTFQGKGLGKRVMVKLIEIVKKEYDIKEIYLSIIQGNKVAYHLYTDIGFVFTNETDPNGELIFKYTAK